MTSPATGPLRAVRVAVVTAVVLLLGVGAHVLGGGRLPTAVVLVVLAVLLAPAVVLATRTRLGTGKGMALLGGAQLGIHLALHAMAPTAGVAVAHHHVHGGDVAVLAALHAQAGAPGAMATMSGMSGMSAMAGLTPTMLLAHAVGTAVTAWLLARGEDVLWRVLSFLLPTVPGRVRLPGRPTALVPALRARRSSALCRPIGSRAPPLPAT